uniref:NADH dehydrogenase subunit 9 n=1 Tax=Toxarium undulatum TaxID=210620 RepID=A0A2U9GIR8_9STRA|nr:NADH dehydrogenase subunit 9 [Toxarium undulatum]AWQ64122.1 NADH dehydrogenase subunit 9 [Toxarium undulatum]
MSSQLAVENIKNILSIFPLEKIQILNEDLVLSVKSQLLVDLLVLLKFHIFYQYEILQCISGVDYPSQKYRFKLLYELLSVRYNFRIRIKTFTYELLGIDSCVAVFKSANWYECEIWDMFGVFFQNHSNLKRILTDYGFVGYPLRKDFPLSGFVEIRFHVSRKRLINEPLELCQEYRNFDFFSSWLEQRI